MQLPPLLPINHNQIYIWGDVTIHPSAVIAPGVLLQAEPDSRIIIAAGVCIGMGSILHSYQGTLEVGESANIGTGVLFVGRGKIGANACVGSSTTIFNTDVQQQQVLPAGSLLGDTSRQSSGSELEPSGVTGLSQQPSMPVKEPESASVPLTSESSSKEEKQTSAAGQEQTSVEEPVSEVYGRTYVNELLVKLMPHRQQLNRSPPDE